MGTDVGLGVEEAGSKHTWECSERHLPALTVVSL